MAVASPWTVSGAEKLSPQGRQQQAWSHSGKECTKSSRPGKGLRSNGYSEESPGSPFVKLGVFRNSSQPAGSGTALPFTSFQGRWRNTAHIRLCSLLVRFCLVPETLYVISSLFVFICQSALLLRKYGVGCLFPAIEAASLKLIVFDLQRSLARVTQESPCWLLGFPAVKAPNGCHDCINLSGREKRKK